MAMSPHVRIFRTGFLHWVGSFAIFPHTVNWKYRNTTWLFWKQTCNTLYPALGIYEDLKWLTTSYLGIYIWNNHTRSRYVWIFSLAINITSTWMSVHDVDGQCFRGKAPDFNMKLASRVCAIVSAAVHGTDPLAHRLSRVARHRSVWT